MPEETRITIRDVYEELKDFRHEMAETYVTRKEFEPVKSIVYGIVSLILVTVATAIVANVVKAVGL